MKKWLSLLVLLILVLSVASAVAAGTSVAPEANRFRTVIPEGLKSTVQYDADTRDLHVSLSADKTDWDKFADKQSAENSASHDVWAFVQLNPPADAVSGKLAYVFGYTNDSNVYTQIQNQDVSTETPNFQMRVGSYLNYSDTISFSPLQVERDENYCCGVVWYDANGAEIGFEKFFISVSWDDLSEHILSSSDGKPVYTYPSADQVELQFDSNLVYAESPTYDPVSGTINAVIDTAATDWEQVLNNWYLPSERTVQAVQFRLQMDSSVGPKLKSIGFGGGNTPAGILESFASASLSDPNGWQGTNFAIGSYNQDSGLFIPQAVTHVTHSGVALQWCDASGKSLELPIEMVRYNIRFTDYAPVQVQLNEVKVGQFIADYTQTGVQTEVEEGKVSYINTTDEPEVIRLVTAVRMPQTGADTSGWRADVSFFTPMFINFGNRMAYPAETGLSEPVLLLEVELPAEDCITSVSGTIRWKDENGQVQMVQNVVLAFEHGMPKPWPEHISNADFPIVPFRKLEFTLHNATKQDGVSLVLDDEAHAVVNWNLDTDKLIEACQNGRAATAMGSVTILDTPPAGAKYYSSWLTGGGTIYGSGNVADFYPYTNSDNPFNVGEGMNSHSPIPAGEMQGMTFPFLNGISFPLANGDTATYYRANDLSTSPYAGFVDAIFWFEDKYSTYPIGCSYITYTFDPAELITTHPVLEDESELDDDMNNGKKKPLIIVDGKALGYGQGKLDLRAERSPSTSNTHRYELTLVNNDNAEVKLKGKGIVYVPYPAGYDETNCHELEIKVGHYSADGSELLEVFSLADGTLTATKFGLRFEVTSLSPFALCWNGEQAEQTTPTPAPAVTPAPTAVPVPSVPQTGDAQPLAVWTMMVMISLAALVFLMRKQMKE